MDFHLLRRAGWDESLNGEVAHVMEYKAAYDSYRNDIEQQLREPLSTSPHGK